MIEQIETLLRPWANNAASMARLVEWAARWLRSLNGEAARHVVSLTLA